MRFIVLAVASLAVAPLTASAQRTSTEVATVIKARPGLGPVETTSFDRGE